MEYTVEIPNFFCKTSTFNVRYSVSGDPEATRVVVYYGINPETSNDFIYEGEITITDMSGELVKQHSGTEFNPGQNEYVVKFIRYQNGNQINELNQTYTVTMNDSHIIFSSYTHQYGRSIGDTLTINMTIQNQGQEQGNVKVLRKIDNGEWIEIIDNVAVTGNSSTTISDTIDTTGMTEGRHHIYYKMLNITCDEREDDQIDIILDLFGTEEKIYIIDYDTERTTRSYGTFNYWLKTMNYGDETIPNIVYAEILDHNGNTVIQKQIDTTPQTEISVTIDNVKVEYGAGTYTWIIRVRNSETNEIYDQKNFTLTVTQAPAFRITSYPPEIHGDPSENVNISITVKNVGEQSGHTQIQLLDHYHNEIYNQAGILLDPGQEHTENISATLPDTQGIFTWTVKAYNWDVGETPVLDDEKQITIDTTPPEPHFTITDYTQELTIIEGQTGQISVTITNDGDLSGDYTIELYDHNDTLIVSESGTLDVSNNITEQLTFTAPEDPGEHTWTIKVKNNTTGNYDDQKQTTITIQDAIYDVDIISFQPEIQAYVNETVTQNVTLQNNGNMQSSVRVSIREDGSHVELVETPVTLNPGDITTVPLSFTAPSSPGTYNMIIEVFNDSNGGSLDDSAIFTLEVEETQPHFVITDYTNSIINKVGEPEQINVTLTNDGSENGTATIYLTDQNSIVKTQQDITINKGDTGSLTLTFTMPGTAGTYTWYIKVYNQTTGNYDDIKAVTIKAINPIITIQEINDITGIKGTTGELDLTITNTGVGTGYYHVEIYDHTDTKIYETLSEALTEGSTIQKTIILSLPDTPGTYTWTAKTINETMDNRIDSQKTFTVKVIEQPPDIEIYHIYYPKEIQTGKYKITIIIKNNNPTEDADAKLIIDSSYDTIIFDHVEQNIHIPAGTSISKEYEPDNLPSTRKTITHEIKLYDTTGSYLIDSESFTVTYDPNYKPEKTDVVKAVLTVSTLYTLLQLLSSKR